VGTISTLMPLWKQARGAQGGISLIYLLRDLFTTADAAPITSPRTCEPGPGTLTATLPADQSIADGVLKFAANSNLPQTRSTDLMNVEAGDGFFVDHWWSGGSRVMIGINTTSFTDYPRIYVDYTWFKLYQGNSSAVTIAQLFSASTWYKLALIARSVGTFFLHDGKLQWVDKTNDTRIERIFGISRSNAGAGNMDQRFDNMSIIDLPANGYTAWDADFSTVTDSKTNPASTTTFNCPADCHLHATFTCENTKYVYIAIRYTDANNYVRLEIDSSRVPTLKKNVAGTPTTLWTGTALTDAVAYQFDVVAEGTSIKVNQDNVLKTTQTVAEHTAVTGGIVTHDLATNDIVLSTHPLTLGIATDRVIAPQDNTTYANVHANDAVIYLRNIQLPPSAESWYCVRYTDFDNTLFIYLNSNGKLRLYSRASGSQALQIGTDDGAVAGGEDICLVMEGVNASLFINGVSVGYTTTLPITTGTTARADDLDGGLVDSWEFFPRDVTTLLPAELV